MQIFLSLLVKEICIDGQFHPPTAGDNRYLCAITQPIDKPIGVSIGVVQGARDFWSRVFYRIVAKDESRSSRAS